MQIADQVNPASVEVSKDSVPMDAEQDNGNPVWEEISPLVWRDSIYSEQAKDSCMGKLFTEEVKLF